LVLVEICVEGAGGRRVGRYHAEDEGLAVPVLAISDRCEHLERTVVGNLNTSPRELWVVKVVAGGLHEHPQRQAFKPGCGPANGFGNFDDLTIDRRLE